MVFMVAVIFETVKTVVLSASAVSFLAQLQFHRGMSV